MSLASAGSKITALTVQLSPKDADGGALACTGDWKVSGRGGGAVLQQGTITSTTTPTIAITESVALAFEDSLVLTVTLTNGGTSRLFSYFLVNPASLSS